MKHRALFALILAPALALGGCAAKRAPTQAAPTPRRSIDATPLVAGHNARVSRLGRLWARGIVALRYTDSNGKKHYEQGDAHLQRLDGDKLALSVTKLGETYFWFGADAERYWLFDLTEKKRRTQFVGRHDQFTQAKADRVGMSIFPRQWLGLAALLPLPANATAWEETSDRIVLVAEGERGVSWRHTLDPLTRLPISVELIEADVVVLRAELDKYRSVILTGVGGDYPKMPARIRVEHLGSGSSVNLVIDGNAIDGKRANKPKPHVFDPEFLIDALGPIQRTIDLDAPAPGEP